MASIPNVQNNKIPVIYTTDGCTFRELTVQAAEWPKSMFGSVPRLICNMRESNISIHGSKIVHRILVNYTEFVCPFCCTTLSPFSNLYICILKGLIDRVKLLGCSFFMFLGKVLCLLLVLSLNCKLNYVIGYLICKRWFHGVLFVFLSSCLFGNIFFLLCLNLLRKEENEAPGCTRVKLPAQQLSPIPYFTLP